MATKNLSELAGYELRSLADSIIASASTLAERDPELREYAQETMDAELGEILDEINVRGRRIANKYNKRFRPMDLRGIKADKDAILGRGGLR